MKNTLPAIAATVLCASWLSATVPEVPPVAEADAVDVALPEGEAAEAEVPLLDDEESRMAALSDTWPVEETTAAEKRTTVRFRVTARATYDDNIFIQEKETVEDVIWSLAPGLTLGCGDLSERKGAFIVLDYDASAFFFTDHADLNSVDHVAALRAQWSGSKLTLAGLAGFRDLTGTNNETADRINRKLYEAALSAAYRWSDRTTVGAELTRDVSDYANHIDTTESAVRVWTDSEITALTKMGLGVALGRVDVSEGRSQTFQQLVARVNYAIASKLTLGLQAGGELRQIEGDDSQVAPVFSLNASYSPYELLSVRLNGYRRVQPSIIHAGANTVLTGTSIDFSYRFLDRFEFSLGGGLEHTTYKTSGAAAPTRNDIYYTLRTGVSYALRENMRVGAFYQWRTNASSQEHHSFDNQQVGFEASIAF